MRNILRLLRNSAFVLVMCSAPVVCSAAVQLGVELFDGLDEAAISAVKPGSLADANGLQSNDVIVQFDGKRIMSARDLQEQLQGMARPKRGVKIILRRHGGFFTVQLKKRAFHAKPFVAAHGVQQQSVEQCLRSPSADCLRDHLLSLLKSQPDVNVFDVADVAKQFLRVGRPDLAKEFLDFATESFLARSRTYYGFDFVGLAQAHRAAGIPLPSTVLEKAAQLTKQPLDLRYAIRGLQSAGNADFAQQLLQKTLAARRAEDERRTELSSYFYRGIASGYALLGDVQSADAVTLDTRFSPDDRLELNLEIVETLVRAGRHAAVPKALDAQLAAYRTTSPSIDGDHFSEAAWLYWRSGNIAAAEQIAEYLVASRRGDIDATVEVLGLLGRNPEALALIETSMTSAGPVRKAEVDYRLVSGAIRRSGQDVLDSRLRPVVDRALANWRSAYAESTQWTEKYERSISHLYQLRTRNGSDPPSASEMEWQAGPSIEEKAGKSLGSAIASGVLMGLNEARRTDIAPAWAVSARAFLSGDRRSYVPLTFMAMLMAADGHLDQAIRVSEEVFGENRQLEVALDEARTINVPSLAAARDFDSIARIYGLLTRPIQKMNALVDVLIPIAGRCDTCII